MKAIDRRIFLGSAGAAATLIASPYVSRAVAAEFNFKAGTNQIASHPNNVRLKEAFDRFTLVATIEEHSLIGGFGAAVSEWLTDSRTTNQNFVRFGTPDAFFKKSGEQEYAREMLGLSAHQIADKIINALH